MYNILFERIVGKVSLGRMTGRWVGTVKMDCQRIDLCCVKWIELVQDDIWCWTGCGQVTNHVAVTTVSFSTKNNCHLYVCFIIYFNQDIVSHITSLINELCYISKTNQQYKIKT